MTNTRSRSYKNLYSYTTNPEARSIIRRIQEKVRGNKVISKRLIKYLKKLQIKRVKELKEKCLSIEGHYRVDLREQNNLSRLDELVEIDLEAISDCGLFIELELKLSELLTYHIS